MSSPVVLTRHAEKLLYVQNYLASYETRPLMLVGSGANGKSHILLEVSEFPPVNLAIITDRNIRFVKSRNPSSVLKMLIHANGTSADYDFARYLDALVVKFERDPEIVGFKAWTRLDGP